LLLSAPWKSRQRKPPSRSDDVAQYHLTDVVDPSTNVRCRA
jgi:hypothetical protein